MPESYHYLYICAMVCGLQNAITTKYRCNIQNFIYDSYLISVQSTIPSNRLWSLYNEYSGSVIRTTHVTGTFTDIGIIFGRLLRGKTEDMWKLKILFPLAFGFILGAVLSGVFFSYVLSYINNYKKLFKKMRFSYVNLESL